MTTPRIVHVAITERPADDFGPASLSVEPTWDAPGGLDRPTSGGYGLRITHRALADRLAAAMMAGVVYANPTVAVDVNGATYVASTPTVMGRRLNADLRRLGY